MPVDKRPNPSNKKPFTPALSSNFRSAKDPLAPRLAGSAPPSPSLASKVNPFVRALSPGRDNPPTNSLNGNITPRSGTRTSRIGTESPSTPGSNKTTTSTRPRATTSGSAVKSPLAQQQGLGIISPRTGVAVQASQSSPSVVSPTPVYTVHRRVSGTKSALLGDEARPSKFFRADDAKTTVGSPAASDRPRQGLDDRQRFYAGSPRIQNGPLPTKLVADRDSMNEDKFFRADDIPVQPVKAPVRPALQTKKSLASIKSAKSQQPDAVKQVKATGGLTSPAKGSKNIVSQPSSPKKTSPSKSVVSPPSPKQTLDRRRSIGSNISTFRPGPQPTQTKSVSTSSVQQSLARNLNFHESHRDPVVTSISTNMVGNFDCVSTPLLSPETMSPRSISLASSNTVPTSAPSDTDQSELYIPPKGHSMEPGGHTITLEPVSSHQPTSAHPPPSHNDDAANARRERKVLDLEISNSSLLAINKTLERELRKQTTELRRFRRLSRSGRLSLAPTNRSASASTLDTVTEANDEDANSSDLDYDSELDNFDDEEGSLISNDSNSVMSPSSKGRQRARDEKRLMLDLAKHHQLLIDSQKLTQSIKRCLTCTEELIRDGNKALEYRVGIGDVKLGGRVLSHEDLDERGLEDGSVEGGRQRQGLLSPNLTSTSLMEASQWLGNGPGTMQTLDGSAEIKRDLHEILV